MRPEEFRELFSAVILQGSDSFSDLIFPAGKLKSVSALEVYQNAYLARFTDALGEKFETVWKVLGDEDFFETAKNYIRENFSGSYNISDYGGNFPDFLKENYPEHPFLAEIADFEYQVFQIFHLSKNLGTDIQKPTGAEFEDFKISFHPSLRFLKYTYPIYDLWKADDSEDLSIFFQEKDQYLILGKKGSDLWILQIEEWEYIFGKNLSEGKTILESLENSGTLPKGPESISEFLSRLTQNFLVIAISS
ncbi:DNA-binding domain-containing protein [Leptospira sarikeiensis]|uniref:DUF2063 domain-containing protein n=1 Tax=Leptospira sarikeiensis TaxID=2484943 RepID=A0A4R9KE43_9LEPT|nr:DNA-binding domain-containing protein [Leptospira sarikeiensis]TGL63463.1 DUF2063 domain-containing protein [Leptospira sarikeiensis]